MSAAQVLPVYGPVTSLLPPSSTLTSTTPADVSYIHSPPYSPTQGEGSTTQRKKRVPFYNTREGDDIIQSTRSQLSARSKPTDSSTHRSSVQDNRQRVYHGECVLPGHSYLVPPSTTPRFNQYPLQEYNRFNAETHCVVGPSLSVPLKKPPQPQDVHTRYDLVRNIKSKQSKCNFEHGLPFYAKHTNN